MTDFPYLSPASVFNKRFARYFPCDIIVDESRRKCTVSFETNRFLIRCGDGYQLTLPLVAADRVRRVTDRGIILYPISEYRTQYKLLFRNYDEQECFINSLLHWYPVRKVAFKRRNRIQIIYKFSPPLPAILQPDRNEITRNRKLSSK